MSKTVIFLVLAALLISACVADAADKADNKIPVRKARSVLQACRKQVPALCPDRKDVMKCLQDNVAAVTDEDCKSWVTARKECLESASQSDKCAKKENPRSCLRTLKKEDLSESCTSSDFYKSVRMFGSFKRRGKASNAPNAGKAI